MKTSELYKLFTQYFLVDIDTRKIRKNTLYFALKGTNFNGNKFAVEAIEKGALYSIVDEKKFAKHPKTILVDDVLKTLQKLANYHRKQLKTIIISLTGSNGKTTTKELINVILKTQYKTTATKGNLNNHIGVPLTLLSIKPSTEIGIIEMGANHHKEIEFLCKIIEPDYGYITNFGKAHLEGFGSVEGVIEAKTELYEYLKKHGKIAFVNKEDKIQIDKTKQQKKNLFPKKDLNFISANPFVKLQYKNRLIKSNLIGLYNYSNIAAAITIGEFFNISFTNIKNAIESYVPQNNRSEVLKTNHNTVILDAYNANPTSVKAALESFVTVVKSLPLHTVILGDMFELGKNKKKEHQEIADLTEKLGFKNVIFIGENFYEITTNYLQFKTFKNCKNYLQNYPIKNHSILIKGSRGMSLERLLPIID